MYIYKLISITNLDNTVKNNKQALKRTGNYFEIVRLEVGKIGYLRCMGNQNKKNYLITTCIKTISTNNGDIFKIVTEDSIYYLKKILS